MNDEEIGQLQEELASVRAELEAFQATVADREAQTAHLDVLLKSAREELAAAEDRAGERDAEVRALRDGSGALELALRDAAERYRAAVLRHSPELPEALIGGDTIDEVDASIARARETVMLVRGHMETQAHTARVPAGAPARAEPDTSGLSASEKIARGIERRRVV